MKQKNLYWFLIDGLSPHFLNICGNKMIDKNFFDDILSKGTVFTNVATTNAGTHTSMHSVFSSMLSSVNGARGWVRPALRSFDENIFTLTDFFKDAGYSTFRYSDADGERCVPMSGFDIWESSGYPIGQWLQKTTNSQKPTRRDNFIRLVKSCNTPRFVYHHIHLLHDLDASLGRIWPQKDYIQNIARTAFSFSKLLEEYDISSDDILIISSDHGVVLDTEWPTEGTRNGERHYEQSVISLFSIVNYNSRSQVIHTLMSAMDEAPTIADLILNIKMPGQGISRRKAVENGAAFPERTVFREKGSYCVDSFKRCPDSSDVFYVREKEWKYVYALNDPRSEWLINLYDGDYQINRKDDFPDKVERYKRMIDQSLVHPLETPLSIYEKQNFKKRKADINPFFSVIIENENQFCEVEDSLLDMAGPYYELIYSDDGLYRVKKSYRQHFLGKPISELMAEDIRGQFVVVLQGDIPASEYLLSDIYVELVDLRVDSFQFVGGYVQKTEDYLAKKDISPYFAELRRYDESERYSRDYLERITTDILTKKCGEHKKIAIYGGGVSTQHVFRFLPPKVRIQFIIRSATENEADDLEYIDLGDVILKEIDLIIIVSWKKQYAMEQKLEEIGYYGDICNIFRDLNKRGIDCCQGLQRYPLYHQWSIS